MDAFEKWWHGPQPILGDGKFHDGKEVAQEAFIAGKAEGIKEGMRLAAEIMRGRKVLASDFYYNLLLKEAGE